MKPDMHKKSTSLLLEGIDARFDFARMANSIGESTLKLDWKSSSHCADRPNVNGDGSRKSPRFPD